MDVRNKRGTLELHALVISDVFRGQIGDRVQTLLEDKEIIWVFVPSSCIDLLRPLDLSVNKALKSKLSSCFSAWYSQEDSKQIEAGTPPDAVRLTCACRRSRSLAGSGWCLLMTTSDLILTS